MNTNVFCWACQFLNLNFILCQPPNIVLGKVRDLLLHSSPGVTILNNYPFIFLLLFIALLGLLKMGGQV